MNGVRRRFLERFCDAALPGPGRRYPTPREHGTVQAVADYLASLHPFPRTGLLLLIDGLNVLPLTMGFTRPMAWLPDHDVLAFLHRLERNPIYAIRNGLVALKALVFVVYYSDPEIEALTGYGDECIAEAPAPPVPWGPA